MIKKNKQVVKYKKGVYPFGVNLIGDIRAETGLGQSMRIVATILEKSNIPFVIIQIDQPGNLQHNDSAWEYRIVDTPRFSINLIHINASEWAENYVKIDKTYLDHRYNIAYWLWELENFPKKWGSCLLTVDEVWAPSDFICDCIRKCTDKPVNKMPYSIVLPEHTQFTRTDFGMKDDVFYYLLMYDFKSVSERKNPKGALNAFVNAFSSSEANREKIGLIVKINHLENQQEIYDVKKMLKEYENVIYVTENMDRREIESLISNSNALISLHRSEGFGLPVAEAMYYGVPVVSTNWSATAEFVNSNNSCPVDYCLKEIKVNIGPYEKGNQWAYADEYDAAQKIKFLFYNKDEYKRLSKNAMYDIRKCFSVDTVGMLYYRRLKEIV